MLVKLDESLGESLAGVVAAHGHTARTVRDQGWGGVTDRMLWPRIVAEEAFFVTTDKGFGDVRSYPPGSHHGILVLRPARESLPQLRALLKQVLDSHGLESLRASLAVATSRGLRVRRARP